MAARVTWLADCLPVSDIRSTVKPSPLPLYYNSSASASDLIFSFLQLSYHQIPSRDTSLTNYLKCSLERRYYMFYIQSYAGLINSTSSSPSVAVTLPTTSHVYTYVCIVYTCPNTLLHNIIYFVLISREKQYKEISMSSYNYK